LGDGAPLSKTSIDRLKVGWKAEFEAWSKRSLFGKEAVYVWADGIYVKAGLEVERAAMLVIIGAMRDGTKEVLALTSGHRESEESWAEVLRDLKKRGLNRPRLLVLTGTWASGARRRACGRRPSSSGAGTTSCGTSPTSWRRRTSKRRKRC
jgi:transposase-like protein